MDFFFDDEDDVNRIDGIEVHVIPTDISREDFVKWQAEHADPDTECSCKQIEKIQLPS